MFIQYFIVNYFIYKTVMLVKMHNSNLSFKYAEFTQAAKALTLFCVEPRTINGLQEPCGLLYL